MGKEGIKRREYNHGGKIFLYNGAKKGGRNWKVMSDQAEGFFFFFFL